MADNSNPLQGEWALILGASSGFGGATAIELARHGMNIFGVHLDRKTTLANAESIVCQIESHGSKAMFFNVNASDPEKRAEICNTIRETVGTEGQVRTLLHSLAFGALRPYFPEHAGQEVITQKQMEMTLDVMANSLVYWTQDLFSRGLLKSGSRIFAMTSEGDVRAMYYYGAVSAAKAALETHIRQITAELARYGITANSIRAGVTDTPALRKIPGHEVMISRSEARNPAQRLTTAEDVAAAVALLSRPESQWINGNIIGVDGGDFSVA